MDAAGTYRFTQPVVCVVLLIGEQLLPALYKARRNGLCADMHEPPRREIVIRKVDFSRIDSVKNVLCPRDKQPHYRAFFLGCRAYYPLGLNAFQKHRSAAYEKRAEPVHFCSGVVKRGNAEKYIVLCLRVVGLLRSRRVHESAVRVEYRFREARCSGGIVYRSVVGIRQLHSRRFRRAVVDEGVEAVGKGRAVAARIKPHFYSRDPFDDLLYSSRKLRAEHDVVAVRLIEAVFYLIGGVSEIQRNRNSARFEYSEISRQPFKAVHHQNCNLVALFYPS